MKIFVTVGSAPFDPLIDAVDQHLLNSHYEITCQVGKGGLQSKKHQSFEYTDDFIRYWQQAELVICHCGAATVFELLEAGKKILVVPNTFRVDDHQLDLAEFVQQNQYGGVCHQLSQLAQCVNDCQSKSFTAYYKEPFFMTQSLLHYFGVTNG